MTRRIVGDVAGLVGRASKEVKQAIADSQYSQYEPVPLSRPRSHGLVEYLEAHESEFPGVSVNR